MCQSYIYTYIRTWTRNYATIETHTSLPCCCTDASERACRTHTLSLSLSFPPPPSSPPSSPALVPPARRVALPPVHMLASVCVNRVHRVYRPQCCVVWCEWRACGWPVHGCPSIWQETRCMPACSILARPACSAPRVYVQALVWDRNNHTYHRVVVVVCCCRWRVLRGIPGVHQCGIVCPAVRARRRDQLVACPVLLAVPGHPPAHARAHANATQHNTPVQDKLHVNNTGASEPTRWAGVANATDHQRTPCCWWCVLPPATNQHMHSEHMQQTR